MTEPYRISTNLPTSEKIRLLNEMIMTLSGRIDQAKFNKTELDQIFTTIAGAPYSLARQYLRDQNLGHTTGTYAGWSHIKAEAGYSIWKYTPTNYEYNALNEMYFDGVLLENRGQATSGETATSFDKVFLYNSTGSAYVDNTTEAGTETGTQFSLMDETGDYLYIGHATTFGGLKIEFETRGSGYSNVYEYWNGSSWTALTYSVNALVDDTNEFESDGLVSFTIPGDWATTSINSSTKYWLRVRTTVTPVTVAEAYYIIPATSVVGLLAMDSDDIIAGNWAWCSYSTSVYVTIRNAGATTGEGDYYITSSSSALNLQNFFIYNHTISANYSNITS